MRGRIPRGARVAVTCLALVLGAVPAHAAPPGVAARAAAADTARLAASTADSAAVRLPVRRDLPVTGRAPVDTLAPRVQPAPRSPARPAPAQAEPSLLDGHDLAGALAQRAPWLLAGAPVPGGWRGLAFPGCSPAQEPLALAGLAWRDPLEAGADASTMALWPWHLEAGARGVTARTTLSATVPSRSLIGYEAASDGARDLRAAVSGRIFGDADVVGWLTASDADRRVDGGARIEDRTEVLQLGRPLGARARVVLTLLNLPSLRERAALVDRGDGAGTVAVAVLTRRRPRVLDATWTRRDSAADSARVSLTWTTARTDVEGVLGGAAWSEAANAGVVRAAAQTTRGALWVEGALQRETLGYRATAPTAKPDVPLVVLADTSRARGAAECTAGVGGVLPAGGAWRAGARVHVPGPGAIFLDPVAELRIGAREGWSLQASWEGRSTAPTLLEPVRRVSEVIAARAGDSAVERSLTGRAGVTYARARGVIRVDGFHVTDGALPMRDAPPFDAELAVRRATQRVSLQGAIAALDLRLSPALRTAARGVLLLAGDGVLADAERPRTAAAWTTTWAGRCVGVDCSLGSTLALTARTPSRVAANLVPATAQWDAVLAVHLSGAWVVVRGENLAGRPLGPASAPFSTTPRLMAGVLLSLLD